MHARQNALNEWLKTLLEDTSFSLVPLAGDASFRRYWRLHHSKGTYVVMDAPPEKETIGSFIHIGGALAQIGIHTPAIYAVEARLGFVLLEDLGDQLLLQALSPDQTESLYRSALTTLIKMQTHPLPSLYLPSFDQAYMLQELALFRQWFLETNLQISLNFEEIHMIEETFTWLTDEIAKQPQTIIHKDYHSRNLIVVHQTPEIDLGVIDFQDAMFGPFTYDVVSLLKDAYVQWPEARIHQWLSLYLENLPIAKDFTFEACLQFFELCGLQRHLKILGIFSRLNFRDNKPNYLHHVPLTLHYVMNVLSHYKALQPFNQFMMQKVYPVFQEQPSC